MMDGISIPIRKLQKKKNSILLKYRSHQNQNIFAYQIKNQIQRHCIARQHHIIFTRQYR